MHPRVLRDPTSASVRLISSVLKHHDEVEMLLMTGKSRHLQDRQEGRFGALPACLHPLSS